MRSAFTRCRRAALEKMQVVARSDNSIMEEADLLHKIQHDGIA